jgi:lysophosphatidylcholine acyltransferase/lyso-PAF acetyltransferase
VLVTRHVFTQGEPGKGAAIPGIHGSDYEAPKPFVRQDKPPDAYELLKTSVMLMVLPVRALLCVVWLSVVWLIYHMIVFGADLSKPLKKYQLSAMHYVGRVAHTGLLLLFGFWVTVKRPSGVQQGEEEGASAGVVVCNHVSYFDIPLCGSIFGSAFIAKAAVQHLPFFGFVSRAQQCCFVSNKARAGSAAAAEQKNAAPVKSTTQVIMDRQAEPEKWPPLLMFPEGTTTNGAFMTVFRSGAFVSGRPVQPVSIRYPFKHFSPAYESMYGKYHVFRALTQVVNYAEITVLPAYYPSEAEQSNPKLYAKNVGTLIAADLDIELTATTFADKLKYLKYLRGDNETRLKVD